MGASDIGRRHVFIMIAVACRGAQRSVVVALQTATTVLVGPCCTTRAVSIKTASYNCYNMSHVFAFSAYRKWVQATSEGVMCWPNIMIAVTSLGAQRSSDGLKGLSVQSIAQKYRTYDIMNAI